MNPVPIGLNPLRWMGLLLLAGCPWLSGCGDEPSRPAPVGARAPDAQAVYDADGRLLVPLTTKGPRPDLLIVVLDELRADLVPFWTEDGIFSGGWGKQIECDAAVTPAPESAAALACLLTGRLASKHRVDPREQVPRLALEFATLPEILRTQGYATRAFVSSGRLALATTLWQGCEIEPQRVGMAQAPAAIARWAATLPSGTPYCAIVQGDESAAPYGEENHAPRQSEFSTARIEGGPGVLADRWFRDRVAYEGDREARLREGGPAALAERERELRRFLWQPRDPDPGFSLERLSAGARDAYERALLWVQALADALLSEPAESMPHAGQGLIHVFTATSGTAFGEHGILGSGRHLYDEQVHVPLTFTSLHGPARRLAEPASLVDVLPTILDLLQLPALPGIDGVSLLPIAKGQAHHPPVISETHQDVENTGDPNVKATLVSVRSARWKYIVRLDERAGTVVEEAYDLKADPGEKHDLAKDGVASAVGFDAEFCGVVERVRDGIWATVSGHNAMSVTAYAQGQPVRTNRPPPCGK